jgi:hypothetical protein
MPSLTSAEKRRRAALFPALAGPTPSAGSLAVRWASPFDRSCFMVSAPELAAGRRPPYEQLMEQLTSATGCTEGEILAHGNNVRARLFFAEDRLARTGALASLVGEQKHRYELAAVRPDF